MSSGFDPVPSDRLEVTSEVGAALTDFDYRVAASLLKLTHSLRWPKDTLSYLTERIALEGFQIPVSQLSGFSGFTANFASAGDGSWGVTTSTSFGNLDNSVGGIAVPGPVLSGLPGGKYAIFVGCAAQNSTLDRGTHMAVQINSDAVSVNHGPKTFSIVSSSIMRGFLVTLTEPNNTLTGKYKVLNAADTGAFTECWVLALKYDNL